jgi:polar amino acid transport system substrate-binding protein
MCAAHAADAPPYVVAYSDTHPFSQGLVTFLTEAYRRVGVSIVARAYPPARSVEMANRGEVDAEAARVPDAMGDMDDLIAVPEPIGHNETYAYTAGGKVTVDGWESLRPYRLCVTVGDLITMKRTKGMTRQTAHDLPSLFHMLASGRCDAAVSDGAAWLAIDKLQLGHFRMMDTPIQSFPVYHYVNRRHADLVPALARAFAEMQQEGVARDILAPYLDKIRESRIRNSVMP